MQTHHIHLGQDSIYTDSVGIKQLLTFFEECKKHHSAMIHIAFDNVRWFDGNLCAFLGALLYRLKQENNLKFSINADQVIEHCDILFHNDFLPIEQNFDRYKKQSAIPFKGFLPKQTDEFTDYLEYEVLSHPAMPVFSSEIKEKLIDDLIEIYGNIDKHAETMDPFFVCGQHYPKKEIIKFTICDLGVGFYKKIKEQKPDQIRSHGDAILWAVEGNSTKPDAPGGKGLKNLHQYLSDNRGGIQIFTGNSNWCSKTMAQNIMIKPQGVTVLEKNFLGSSISLEFNKKTLLS